MRVMFFSNYYPPLARGGYEMWCAEVAEAFRQRGHQVAVVTSGRAVQAVDALRGIAVHRVLDLEASKGKWETARKFFLRRRELERVSLARIEGLVKEGEPDLAFFWGMWNVPRAVPARVEQLLPNRVAYYFCDYWPTLPSAYEQYWSTPSGRSAIRLVKELAARQALRQLGREARPELGWQNCICVSRYVCRRLANSGIAMKQSSVVYGGTQIEQFSQAAKGPERQHRDRPLRLLYAGRVVEEKGVHTVIEALGKLPKETATLTIVGSGDQRYYRKLHEMIDDLNLSRSVTFQPAAPRKEMPVIMADHDVLVFSSIWEEPFARTVIEAMAAGLLVIGTTSGGTGEILENGVTGLTYPAGDAEFLARQIKAARQKQGLMASLSQTGCRLVREQFRFEQMVDGLEEALHSVIAEAETISAGK